MDVVSTMIASEISNGDDNDDTRDNINESGKNVTIMFEHSAAPCKCSAAV